MVDSWGVIQDFLGQNQPWISLVYSRIYEIHKTYSSLGKSSKKQRKICESGPTQVTWKVKFKCQLRLSWLYSLTCLTCLSCLSCLTCLTCLSCPFKYSLWLSISQKWWSRRPQSTSFRVKSTFLFSSSDRNWIMTRCQIWCTIELHRDPISKVLLEW